MVDPLVVDELWQEGVVSPELNRSTQRELGIRVALVGAAFDFVMV